MRYPYYKCENHLHLDGSFAPEDAWQFAQTCGIKTGYDTLAEYRQHAHVRQHCASLYEYLACFDLPLNILQYRDALSFCAYRLGKRLAQTHVLYAEIRFAPQLHTRGNLTQEDAICAVLEGIHRAMEEEHIYLQIILCMMTLAIDTEQANRETLRLGKQYLGCGVCALDLAGAEGIRPMEEFRSLFAQAKADGIPFTIHAGENGYPEHIRLALEFGARRIGHGVHVIEDIELMQACREAQILFELCYTSNLQCHVFPDGRKHPIRTLYDAQMRISINTDNQIVSNTSLDQEYDALEHDFQFTVEEIRTCNEHALQAAFLPEDKKKELYQELIRPIA